MKARLAEVALAHGESCQFLFPLRNLKPTQPSWSPAVTQSPLPPLLGSFVSQGIKEIGSSLLKNKKLKFETNEMK